MDFIEILKGFIRPELLILVPVLYFIGIGLKKSQYIADRHIPILLGAAGVALSAIWLAATASLSTYQDVFLAIFAAFTQGILCAAGSVYVNQIIRQAGKGDNDE
ncbi:MAG: phage holin family protein [Christensenella sp.]